MSAINAEGVRLLKESETFVGVAYPDPYSPLGKALREAGLWRGILRGSEIPSRFKKLSGAPWTIGYGFTHGVKPGDTMSRAEADARLDEEIADTARKVRGMCTIEPNENQLAALVVCTFNIGVEGMRKSTMIRAHNRGDFAAAARAFNLWNKAGGVVAPGLVRRRAAEGALYLKPVPLDGPMDDEEDPASMPQAVASESSLLRSPIVQATTGAGTTAVATLASVADQVQTVNSSVSVFSTLLPYWPYILIFLVLVVSGAVIYYRWKQRKDGWA